MDFGFIPSVWLRIKQLLFHPKIVAAIIDVILHVFYNQIVVLIFDLFL